MLLPENIAVCDECEFKINCSDQGGNILSGFLADSHLIVKYGVNGKLIGIVLPNNVKFFSGLHTPIFTVCHGKICSLPLDNAEYHRLSSIIYKNEGSIEICNYEEFKLELLG